MTTPRVLGSAEGEQGLLGGMGVRWMIGGRDTGERFSLVEHPMPPRALAAPMHRHSLEDEYSFVLEGRVGAKLGDDVLVGGPGDLIFKPRDQWHTFWNAGDEPARILELISPAGFERYFREVVAFPADVTPEERAALGARYGLEVDPSSIPGLLEDYGLRFGPRAGD